MVVFELYQVQTNTQKLIAYDICDSFSTGKALAETVISVQYPSSKYTHECVEKNDSITYSIISESKQQYKIFIYKRSPINISDIADWKDFMKKNPNENYLIV